MPFFELYAKNQDYSMPNSFEVLSQQVIKNRADYSW